MTVGATKAGVTSPSVVTRPLAVDLTAPSVSYMAPATLKVGVFTAVALRAPDTDIAWYRATGLPSGLSIPAGVVRGHHLRHAGHGRPRPGQRHGDGDRHGRQPHRRGDRFPAVAKGDQTLVDFSYSPHTVTFGDSAPTVMEPIALRPYLDYFDYLEQGASFFEQGPFFIRGRVQTGLSYSAAPSDVCTVDLSTGALTLLAVGECEVTATAAGTANYNDATATFTVTVQPGDTAALRLDDIAGDNAVEHCREGGGVHDLRQHRFGRKRVGDGDGGHDGADRNFVQRHPGDLVGERAGECGLHHRHQRCGDGERHQDRLHLPERT